MRLPGVFDSGLKRMRDSVDKAPLVLRLDGVVVRAGETMLLDDVSLQIHAGAPTIIVGPNGAGKTTLLRCVMGLVERAAGEMQIDAMRRAIVFQHPVMLRRTVAENISFALQAAQQGTHQSAVHGILEQVGLLALADRSARRLSGGERQRLGIARALARRPQLLLLDEATASLDPAQTKIIEDLIVGIANSGVKILIATHDLGQARRLANDIVFMVNGRVVEHALADDFFNRPASDAARRFIAGELVI
jgi:tungstate transport system ATP-binding protein